MPCISTPSSSWAAQTAAARDSRPSRRSRQEYPPVPVGGLDQEDAAGGIAKEHPCCYAGEGRGRRCIGRAAGLAVRLHGSPPTRAARAAHGSAGVRERKGVRAAEVSAVASGHSAAGGDGRGVGGAPEAPGGGGAARRWSPNWQDTGLVFTTTIGTVIEPRNLARVLDSLVPQAGAAYPATRHAADLCVVAAGAGGQRAS